MSTHAPQKTGNTVSKSGLQAGKAPLATSKKKKNKAKRKQMHVEASEGGDRLKDTKRSKSQGAVKVPLAKGKKVPPAESKGATSAAVEGAGAASLDDLFSGFTAAKKQKKRHDAEAGPVTSSHTAGGSVKAAGAPQQAKKRKGKDPAPTQSVPLEDDDGFFDSRGKKNKRKYTSDGFPIYTENELKISADAGTTPLCPFDCQCCF
eukprot:m.201901 g.201901  ORF g.201901 m.201901 type:complete len:205 (-) comp21618_c0_seq1:64-678(-)